MPGNRSSRRGRGRWASLSFAVLVAVTPAVVACGSGAAGDDEATSSQRTVAKSGAADRPLYSYAADAGLPGKWADRQDGTTGPALFGRDARVSIVSEPQLLAGHDAFQFRSQAQPSPQGPRAELAGGERWKPGTERWIGDVLRVNSEDWARDSHHSVMQFKGLGAGSAPVSLDIREWGNRDSGLGLWIAYPTPRWHRLVPMADLGDTEHQIEVRVLLAGSTKGEVEVWIDGARALELTDVQTMMPDGRPSYFKQGQYGAQASNLVWWLGALVGESRASVLPAQR